MSFTQMLVAFHKGNEKKAKAAEVKKGRSQGQIDNIYKAHEGQTKKATARYRAAMIGKGWMTTEKVEMALGCSRTTANPFLRKLYNNLKLVDRRPKDNKPYNRRTGWEWKWKLEENDAVHDITCRPGHIG